MVAAALGDSVPARRRPHRRAGFVRAALVLACPVLLALLLAGSWLLVAQPLYTAVAIVYPAEEVEPRQPGSLGGLSLVEPATAPPTPFQKFLAVLHTPRFIAALDQRLSLARTLFPAEWDADRQRWRTTPGLRAWLESVRGRTPTPFDPERALAAYFDSHLTIAETDKRNAITRVAFTAADRPTADRTLKAGLEIAQALLVEQEAAQLTQEIAYLEDQLNTVALAEHRTELARLLSERERRMMLLKAGAYGAQILQPVYTPPEPEQPSVRLTLLLAVLAGAALGTAALCLQILRAEPPS